MWHLYEVVISNSRVWLKVQASCSSSEQSAAFFEFRFNGTDYTPVDGHRPVTPFRLSQRSHYLANWVSMADRLPAGWDNDEFHIVGLPIHGAKLCLTTAIATDRKGDWTPLFVLTSACTMTRISAPASPTTSGTASISNRWRERIAGLDESRREERLERERRSPPRGEVLFEAKPEERGGEQRGIAGPAAVAIGRSQPNGCPGVVLLDPRKASPIRRAGHTENDGAPYRGLRTNVDFE